MQVDMTNSPERLPDRLNAIALAMGPNGFDVAAIGDLFHAIAILEGKSPWPVRHKAIDATNIDTFQPPDLVGFNLRG